ncbi:MAG TPA: multicopper oxidase family protein [Paraburkholderia sp.]|uniref:multicopper oxidase family protein n=1 Tax=Paraburkholderia sp. TaxID=1926495 RepID=UPI002B494CBA|nr:multicopper oxidase family protein [Paraburkholderia sp.]HKR47468.1 multicopper oxidase family protein [Paraburkholderia sp.]
MFSIRMCRNSVAALLCMMFAIPSFSQSFMVQCPPTTPSHPTALPAGAGEPPYTGPSFTGQTSASTGVVNGAVKCQQISGGDGYATMANGVQTYLFAFGPLSGLADIKAGLPGTEFASVFNTVGDPRTDPTYNGAVGLTPDPESTPPGQLTGHVDPRPIMDIGVMNGNEPAPTMAIDEDDEFFLTLTNVGMIMRPDLFERHTVHFHGYPNASSFYDGVPDASVAINIGASFTYYYLAPDAGTYFWHCHITPPEHLQMGMVGQIFVRPRQDRVPAGQSLYQSLVLQQQDLRTRCGTDILCTTPLPPQNGVLHANNLSGTPTLYAYNDGDGSTAYDVEYPVQIHGFDPNFHFVGMTFNPEPFTDMKDKFFMLNGRSYPDTVNPNPLSTPASDGVPRFSQPLPSLINIPVGGKVLLRISDLDVTEYQTLASLGIPMHVVAVNARLLRDMAGNDMTYYTNSITLGGGESLDLILDASDTTKYQSGQVFYLYTPNLDHLANDQENFGGLMTEVHICRSVDPKTKVCTL